MIAKSVGELISSWYGRDRAEFLATYTEPVLIGVGVLDVRLLRDPHRHGSTLCLGFEHVQESTDDAPNPLVGIILAISARPGGIPKKVTVGRGSSCDIIVNDPSVSENHCTIELRGESLNVFDLGSTNGTLINGTPLEPPMVHTLRDEDVLTLGRHSFQFFNPIVLFQYLQLSPPMG